MSLLMQALKKAERAKLNSGHDDELEKPSEAYDQVLSLTPHDGAAATPPGVAQAAAAAPLALDLAPMDGLSLAPLDAPAPAFAPMPSPAPASINSGSALTLDFDHGHAPAVPVQQVALEALHDPVPAQAQAHPADGMAGLHAAPPEFKTMAAPSAVHVPQTAPAGTAPAQDARASAAASAGARAGASAGARVGASAGAHAGAQAGAQAAQAGAQAARAAADKHDSPSGAQRGAARARGAAAAMAAGAGGGKAGIDPAKMRLMILSGIAVAIIGVFGYIYWQATNAPGAGARLPPVPMPPANATGASPALVVVANPGANAGVIGGPAANGTSGTTTSGAMAGGNPADMPEATDETEAAQAGAVSRLEQLVRQLDQRSRELEQRQQQLAQQAAQPPRETLTPVAAPPEASDIRVGRSAAVTQLNPDVQNAYQSYTSGDLAQARQQYETALRDDPNNRDALLGTAAMAIRQNQGQAAAAAYLRLLELDPNDADALAGLAGMRQVDTSQAELRLKAILKRNPDSGPLNFALGNVYARQGRWPEAQQSYFRAYSASPDNADYAFNLAVGLDRLNQPKLAINYYQHALAAPTPGGFDRTAVRKRLQELAPH